MSPDTRRLLIAGGVVLGMIAVSALFWQLGHVLLLLFGAALFGVLIDAVTRFLERWTGCSRALGVAATLCLLLTGLAALFVFAGPAIAEQLNQLVERLPGAVEEARRELRRSTWGRMLVSDPGSAGGLAEMASDPRLMQQLPSAFSSVFGVAVELLVVLLIGVYLAAGPDVYLKGALHLVPTGARPRAEQVLGRIAHALRAWLLGRIASMTVVAALTALGLWAVGSPLPLALGVIAGLFSFVPYVGPIVAAVPGLLIAVSAGLTQVLQVAAVYLGVQVLESNAITPLIQWRAVAIPPALLLAMQMVMTVLFGALGVLLATPLLVALIVLVQTLYVREVLGDEVGVLPDRGGGPGKRSEAHRKAGADRGRATDERGPATSTSRRP